jgi:hypothetical protein
VRAQQIDAPQPQRGSIHGTVTDVDDAAIPGASVTLASVTLDGPAASEQRTLNTDETGSFELKDLDPAVSYKISVSAKGFADWTSPAIVLTPGQALEMTDIKLKISVVETTVVALTVEQLATQQVKAEEKQRVLGIVPNFFVVYDRNAVPLTTKLKYELAFKAATDVVSIAGDFVLAGVNQAADTPNYQQGAKGYGQRFGAAYADSFTNCYDRRRRAALTSASGPAVLLPRYGHGEVARDSRDFKPIYLQGRQRPFAVQLLRHWWQSDRGLAHQHLLSAEQSRTGIGLLQHSDQHRRPTRQRFGPGVCPAQVYDQCEQVKVTD